MPIPTWRLVLTGGAVAILAVAGIGFVAAANAPAGTGAEVANAESTAAPNATTGERPGAAGKGERWGARRLLHFGRHLVHADVTVTGRDGELINLQLDHGTVQSIGGGTITIAEAGGGTETVSTNEATIVHLGREDGDLGDVKVGAEVFVQSRIDGVTTLAKRILVVPAAT